MPFDPHKLPFFRREVAYEGKTSEDFFEFAVEVAADEVFLMRADSKIVYVNRSAARQLGYKRNELIGKFVWEWDPLFKRDAWSEFWQEFIEAKHLHFETQHCTKQGKVFPVEIHAHLYECHDEKYLLALVNDLTEKKKNEKLIYQQANYDQLTGLPNRYLLMDRLNHALLSAQRGEYKVALLFLDLDGFKKVNDTHGHHVGDELLIEVALRIGNHTRESDTVARLGGDEFVIIIENPSPDNIRNIADKLCAELAKPYELSVVIDDISTSIGIAVYPDDAQTHSNLLVRADSAMYVAKEKGKNGFQLTSALSV